MKEPSKLSATLQFLKLIFACFLGVLFLVFSAIVLRKICIPTTHASSGEFIHIKSPTTLYKSNSLEGEILTIPEGYYAELLSKTENLARVQYNSVVGFIELNSSHELTIEPTSPYFQTAEIKTKKDAGTYLRATPSTSAESIAIIPPDVSLTYIGEISGEQPTDGTSNSWFYVHYLVSDTMVHTGYIYSERVNIISGKLERPTISNPPETDPITDTTQTSTGNSSIMNTPISAGVKIFLGILFSTLAIIIFALLIISPHEKKESFKRPSVHGQKTDSFNEKTDKNGGFYPENGKISPKTAKKWQNNELNSGFSTKNSPAWQKKAENAPKITQKQANLQSKILPQTAREAEIMQNNNKNKNKVNTYQNSPSISNSEYGSFHDFVQKENSHSITSTNHQQPSNRRTRKKELILMGEKNGSLPKSLSRYFDIE